VFFFFLWGVFYLFFSVRCFWVGVIFFGGFLVFRLLGGFVGVFWCGAKGLGVFFRFLGVGFFSCGGFFFSCWGCGGVVAFPS